MGLRVSETQRLMRIIIEDIDWSQAIQPLPATMVHYCVHVHRQIAGCRLVISDGAGQEAEFTLLQQSDNWQIERNTEVIQSSNVVPITLFCGLPKGDKLDRVTRQASELGIAEIVLLKMSRNVVQLDGTKAAKRLARLERVALEAARQSERSRVLKLSGVYEFSEGIQQAISLDNAFYFHPGRSEILPSLDPTRSCGIFVGPEGGFSETECDQMTDAGIVRAHLGHTILRTETASIAGIVAALSKMGHL